MFTSFSIRNFKLFRNFTIERLQRVNLIMGMNDTGKTALLEAIFLLIGEGNAGLVPRIHAARGLDKFRGGHEIIREWFWTPLVLSLDATAQIEIEGRDHAGDVHRVTARLVPRSSVRVPKGEDDQVRTGDDGADLSSQAILFDYTMSGKNHPFSSQLFMDEKDLRVEPPRVILALPGHFLAARVRHSVEEDARTFSELEIGKELYDVVSVLRIVEPRLTRISSLLGPGGTMLWGDIGLGKMLPLSLLGDVLARLATLILRIAVARGGLVLVDEVENGLHHSVLPKVWSAIAQATRKFDVQLFATTHSAECIRSAHEAFAARGLYDFRLYRLDRIDDDVKAVAYDQETLATSLEMNLEVR